MPLDFTFALLAFVGVFIGWLATYTHYRRELKELRLDLNEAHVDLSGSYSSGWAEGWESAHATNKNDYAYYQNMYRQITGTK